MLDLFEIYFWDKDVPACNPYENVAGILSIRVKGKIVGPGVPCTVYFLLRCPLEFPGIMEDSVDKALELRAFCLDNVNIRPIHSGSESTCLL